MVSYLAHDPVVRDVKNMKTAFADKHPDGLPYRQEFIRYKEALACS